MQRTFHSFAVNNIQTLKQQMLTWANRFSICCFLDNHSYHSPHHTAECICGAGAMATFAPGHDFFQSLSSFVTTTYDYIFGHFNYEIKNKTAKGLRSEHIDYTGFPGYFMFVPEVILIVENNTLQVGIMSGNAHDIYQQIISEIVVEKTISPVHVQQRITKEEYLQAVKNLQHHIHIGDCYVINYCQEFFALATIDPLTLYRRLSKLSPNPFAAFYKLHDKYLLCASPERFIKKEGSSIFSQPIKGTAARSHTDKDVDDINKEKLQQSQKDRSENIMVVDLVRNDLSRICMPGTVAVDELCSIYSFPNVHQMISTISGQLCNDMQFGDILQATFPMGSMTGAPKHRVMELSEQYEYTQRGIYSGTVGYIDPNKDFDFNVVIRSMVYNGETKYLSYHTGGAITAASNPEEEYEECLLKGSAIAALLSDV